MIPILCSMLAAACGSGPAPQSEALFELLPPERTGIDFVNQLEENEELNVITFEGYYNGAGVGVGDVNGDGRPDLFFVSNTGQSRLYLNEGDLRFRDVTDQSGILARGKWANGVAMADVNQDGHLDIHISYGGPYASPERRANELYVNNGDGVFTERAAEFGLADSGVTIQSAFFDYDRDGDLDVYLLTNGMEEVGPNVIAPKKTNGESITTDRLYRNNGDGTFTDVSREANVLIEGHGLGIAVSDVNSDGWPDVYVANDYLSNDILYVNNGDGTFTDRAAQYLRHQSYAAMGVDVADFNNDGLPDVMTADMLSESSAGAKRMHNDAGYDRHRSERLAGYAPQYRRNTLQLNNGKGPDGKQSFSDVGLIAGVATTDWSWSVLFGDFDNDGWRDLLVTNGIPRDITNLDFAEYKIQQLSSRPYDRDMMLDFVKGLSSIPGRRVPNYLFRNNMDLTFSDVSDAWGFDRPSYSTGAAYADLDNDGDLDLVMNNHNEVAFVYRNTSRERTGNSYLQVNLEGPDGNATALGAQVAVYYAGQSQYAEQIPYRGYLSSVEPTIHFGLGTATVVDSLVVEWPDGSKKTLVNVPANSRRSVKHEPRVSNDPYRNSEAEDDRRRLFANVTDERAIHFVHTEKHYDDFKIQPLLPHKYSQNGPGLAVGDVNGDDLDDFYVGGAFSQAGSVFLQRRDGSFHEADVSGGLKTVVSGDRYYEEDMGALFFDANGDSHLDLYVVSGGSEFDPDSKYYQDRLYLGDGKGGFLQDSSALPDLRSSGSTVIAGDFDRDGDLDLFVGGRVVPGQYPAAPDSYVLENRGGRFVDVTERVGPALRNIGLVTAALWTDFNGDQWPDLVLVGEWMPITFFQNREGVLVNVTEQMGTSNTVGWWNSIVAGDFDRDGDSDYVAGNLGLNTTLRNRPEGPVRAYVKDFNRDGRLDAVLSRYVDAESYPVHFRDDFLRQMPALRGRYVSYESYATVRISDVFREEDLVDATVYESDTFASSYIENLGNAGFAVRSLPIQAQLAPVFGVLGGDYDGDGLLDVLLTGNSFATEAFTGPYDALSGLLLRGDGEGGFTPVSLQESGFFVDGDAKSLAEIAGAGGERLILAARNNGELELFQATHTNGGARLRVGPSDVSALVRYRAGKTEQVEIPYGSGYLSQSSRILDVPETTAEVTIYDTRGGSRVWVPGTPSPFVHVGGR